MPEAYDDSLLCPDCGYSLRGISSDRCPECGLDIAFIRENRSVIPWVNRREIGVWRAYWRTVWQVIARRKEFLREVAKPVSYHEAAAFRRMTLGFVALALMIGWCGVWLISADRLRHLRSEYGDWFVLLCAACALAAIRYQSQAGAALIFAPGVPVLLATRVRILSIYSIAPLALSPLPIALAMLLPHLWRRADDQAFAASAGIAITITLIALIWLVELAALAARVLHSRMLANGHSVLSLIAFSIIALFVCVGVPAFVFLLLIVYYAFC